jgi:hypothetical protein
MTTPRFLLGRTGLGLTSACAGRTPLPGPDPVAVRSTIQAQIAQTALAMRQDTLVTALRSSGR